MGRKVAGLFYLPESIKLGLGQRAAGLWAAARGDPGGTSPQQGPRSTCTPSHYRPWPLGSWDVGAVDTKKPPRQTGVKRAELCRSRGCPPKHPVSHLPALAACLPAQPRRQESTFEGKRGTSSPAARAAAPPARALAHLGGTQTANTSSPRLGLRPVGNRHFPTEGREEGPSPFLGGCHAECRLQSPGKGSRGFTWLSRK